MRFIDIQIKIGINLYRSYQSTIADPSGTGKTLNVTKTALRNNKTILFNSFIKKSALTVKPEFANTVAQPDIPRKEQTAVEKFYDMQFEVLAEDKEEAIENYSKLLLMINHLYYLSVRVEDGSKKSVPNRFGNVGIIFKGNPPIFNVDSVNKLVNKL